MLEVVGYWLVVCGVLTFLWAIWRRREKAAQVAYEARDAVKLFKELGTHCPDCGKRAGYYEGPKAGLAVNIFCCNPACRAGFNVAPGLGFAERIGRATFQYPADVAAVAEASPDAFKSKSDD